MNDTHDPARDPSENLLARILNSNPEIVQIRGRRYVAGALHGFGAAILLQEILGRDHRVGVLTLAALMIGIGWLLLRPVVSDVAKLRVMAGDFSESDIDNVFRLAIQLESRGNAAMSAQCFRLVATNSADTEKIRLAKECLRRLGVFTSQEVRPVV